MMYPKEKLRAELQTKFETEIEQVDSIKYCLIDVERSSINPLKAAAIYGIFIDDCGTQEKVKIYLKEDSIGVAPDMQNPKSERHFNNIESVLYNSDATLTEFGQYILFKLSYVPWTT
ncbi:MAG: hypothetical protein U5L96_05985 [Owenweeksia sp.]|nr:hypothetical protein [Owenweeksia sp.]